MIGILGALVSIYPNKYVFLVGRLIVGISVGMNTLVIPIYLNEQSPISL